MIAKNIKESRRKVKLSQEEVSEIINTSRSNISKYETGILEPSLQTLKKLCELYKVSADKVLEINIQEEKDEIIIKKK